MISSSRMAIKWPSFYLFSIDSFVIIPSRKILDVQYFISLLTIDLMGKMDFGMLVKKGAII